MEGVNYKTVLYGLIAERLTDYRLGMFIDGINNYLAMNYGTADFAFSRVGKQYQPAIKRYVKYLDELCQEGECDAEQDH